jgi:hypothetical protein
LGDPADPKARVIKATRPESHMGYGIAYGSFARGATAGEYLDRLAIQNRIFSDDLHIERVVSVGGRLSIVTSQPFIRGDDAPQGDIDRHMAEMHFERIGIGTYYDADEGFARLRPRSKERQERCRGTYPSH